MNVRSVDNSTGRTLRGYQNQEMNTHEIVKPSADLLNS